MNQHDTLAVSAIVELVGQLDVIQVQVVHRPVPPCPTPHIAADVIDARR